MSTYVNDKYRIKRNSKHETQMRYLISDLKVFANYSQILVISAVIGFNNQLFVPIEAPASDAVLMQFFNSRNKDIMDLIAYGHEKKQNILSEDSKYTIFEAYANGGFPLLINQLEIDFAEPAKNDRLTILKKYFSLLLINGFTIKNGTNN